MTDEEIWDIYESFTADTYTPLCFARAVLAASEKEEPMQKKRGACPFPEGPFSGVD